MIYQQSDSGQSDPRDLYSQDIVDTAVRQTLMTLFEQNIVPWRFHPRNSNFEPSVTENDRRFIHHISLKQISADDRNVLWPAEGDVDESYTLRVDDDGQVLIESRSAVGISHALTTFTQLFYAHTTGAVYTDRSPVSIADMPRFKHRGLNLDVARSFLPVEHVLRTIDALAFTKMNRLHLHMTDAQSWPLEVPAMPQLAAKGAYHPTMVYTPRDLRYLQRYGALRGIEVYLEIDMPGHTSSIWHAYPDLIAAFNRQPDWSRYAVEPPSGTLKLNSSAAYRFLEVLWDDVLHRVSPYSSLFHTGGDEVNRNAFLLDDTVGSNDPSVLRPLLQRFVDFNHERIRAAGMTPVVWEDVLLTSNLSLGQDVIVQSWRDHGGVPAIAQAGHRVIAGPSSFWVRVGQASSVVLL